MSRRALFSPEEAFDSPGAAAVELDGGVPLGDAFVYAPPDHRCPPANDAIPRSL